VCFKKTAYRRANAVGSPPEVISVDDSPAIFCILSSRLEFVSAELDCDEAEPARETARGEDVEEGARLTPFGVADCSNSRQRSKRSQNRAV
jgi:hypothetical protein